MRHAAVRVVDISSRREAARTRNPRVRRVRINQWQTRRVEQFKVNVRFAAAAAKSYRIAKGVTQARVAAAYGCTASSVTAWESGTYFGWTEADLTEYSRVVDRIAAARR
jgi:DNA-binding transcriptional regulator YiaG